jgi:hypothetical protein
MMKWCFFKSIIQYWWENKFEDFVVQELGLTAWNFQWCSDMVMYGDPHRDDYENFPGQVHSKFV